MEDQIGLVDRPPQFLLRPPWFSKVSLERAEAVWAKVIGRIDETPAQTTGSLGEGGQLHGKELAQHDLGPEIVDERTDRWQAGVRPCPRRARPRSPGGLPAGREEA